MKANEEQSQKGPEEHREHTLEGAPSLEEPSCEEDRSEPTVVGIGASAGGLAALRTFFDHVPEQSGLAFVVVVHLSPDRESHLAELLQPHVNMPVMQVTRTTKVEADHVYVIPPDANLNTIDTHLRLSELEERRRNRAPIDHFFCTLAETHDGHAIGVILTGTGSDGTLGLKKIQEQGGLTLVQSPEEAEYDGMPRSAIATGLVDRVLTLAELPEAILRLARTEPHIPLPAEGAEEAEATERQLLQKVFAQVRARTGRDFSRYKRSTIGRRLQRRMQLRHLEELSDYLALLREEPEEVKALSDDLLITVTEFFRDPGGFEVLKEEVVPGLFEGKGPDDDVRVWAVGCATGEEAYSLAMLLLEEAVRREAPPRLQVFGSDLHERSLERAREGFYPGDIEADVSEERLERFFQKENGGYRIRQEVRDIVVFASHNLMGDPPFSHLDLVSCRNLLIYLERGVQQEVVELFHYALRPHGFLVLGTSETIETAELFRLADKKYCIYQKRNVQAPEPRLPVFPAARRRLPEGPGQQEEVAHGASGAGEPLHYGTLHQHMVERYAPPSLLVSPDDKVVHLSEHAGRYLEHPGGGITTNVYKLVREELRVELRSALHEARERREPSRSRSLPVHFDGETRPVVLHVRPAPGSEQESFVLVIFDEGAPGGARTAGGEEAGRFTNGKEAATAARERELEAELDRMRHQLESTIEEYETSQEELKASNEELQSSNEELRSTMEELETSKEELQSMNEELQTVNQENRHKVEELSQLSSDLQNLMAATDIATLFLDRELRVVRFTPPVEELFNVRQADRGRPISDFTHRLGYEELQEDAEEVLRRLVPVEREVQDEAKRWYLTRVLPYRSAEDRIEGVVITFVDITERRGAEEELRQSEERFRALVDASASMVWTTDAEGGAREDSPSWRAFTGQSLEERQGWGWVDAIHPEDRAEVGAQWREAVTSGEPLMNEFRIYHAPSGEYHWTTVRIVPLKEPDGSIRGWVGMSIDVTERREAEEKLRRLNETLEERVTERTEQVRDLASRLTMAEQEERRRISQILHDDLQQLLYGVEMKLSAIRHKAEKSEHALQEQDGSTLAEDLEEVRSWVERAFTTTRQLTVDLSPPVLQEEGLADALEWLQTQMKELHGLQVSVEAAHRFYIADEDLRVLLFQIVRKLLFNVEKHAGTDRATVRLLEEGEGDRIAIHVIDQGRGFDVEDVREEEQQQAGFGLYSAQERLRLLGGHLEIHSSPGEGTHVEVHAPAQPEGATPTDPDVQQGGAHT